MNHGCNGPGDAMPSGAHLVVLMVGCIAAKKDIGRLRKAQTESRPEQESRGSERCPICWDWVSS